MLFYCYLDLPKCVLNIETIEELILERYKVYCASSNLQYDTEKFKCYDKIIHLFMSIIAIDFSHFKDIFINGEIKIFQEKLKKQNMLAIKKELFAAFQYLNHLSQNEDFKKLKSRCLSQLQLVKNIIQALLSKCNHIFNKSHSKNCRELKISLPFTFPLKLISKRELEVNNGKASLSCGKWDKILELVFEYFLQIEIILLKNCENLKKLIYELEDDRVRQVVRRFANYISCSLHKNMRVIKEKEIDENLQFFPPCMANLHQKLRLTHRLSYESRYQYTLFLKDIGLSVDENILFWQNEYSKPYKGTSCTHKWEEKQKRYKYQIQHLYGLIGTCGPKSSHSCDKFIGELQSKMDGGCPFQHLTTEELKEVIPKNIMTLPDVEDIFKFKNYDLPQKACAAFLNCQKTILRKKRKNLLLNENISNSKTVYIVSPLQYYSIAKNLYFWD